MIKMMFENSNSLFKFFLVIILGWIRRKSSPYPWNWRCILRVRDKGEDTCFWILVFIPSRARKGSMRPPKNVSLLNFWAVLGWNFLEENGNEPESKVFFRKFFKFKAEYFISDNVYVLFFIPEIHLEEIFQVSCWEQRGIFFTV